VGVDVVSTPPRTSPGQTHPVEFEMIYTASGVA
jgi:hypothetical protein